MRKISGYILAILAVAVLISRFYKISNRIYNVKPATSGVSGSTNQLTGLDRNATHLILTRHARCRMECRHINETELREILHDGSVNNNKSEPGNSRGPKYALEGFTHEHQHLRVIFAPETDGMVVVTCIDLDNEWACGNCN